MNSAGPRTVLQANDRLRLFELKAKVSALEMERRWSIPTGALPILPLLLLVLPTLVQAQFEYSVDNGAVTITKYAGPGGDVLIPDTIDGRPVTRIGDWAFASCSSITSISTPNSVTSLGDGVFSVCANVSSIMLGSSLTNIGNLAFADCHRLTSITLPNSVTRIGGQAFADCSSLTNFTIPNAVTTIGDFTFSRCTALIRVTVGVQVAMLGWSAFDGATSLTAIEVEPANQFYSSLDGVLFDKSQSTLILYPFGKPGGVYSIPETVSSIPNYAFRDCTDLEGVWIPDSVTGIGVSPFEGCSGLTSIEVDAASQSYSSLDGVLFNKSQTTLIRFPVGKPGGAYAIPERASTIGDGAFRGCTRLTSIVISEHVTSIGMWAFTDCTGLTSITIPNSVSMISPYALSGCANLTRVTIPNSVTSIGPGAFSGCTSLASMTIPDSVVSVADWAFADCTSLTSLEFQGNRPIAGSKLFEATTAVTVYYLPGSTGWGPTLADRPTALWIPIIPMLSSLPVDTPLRLFTHSPAPATVRVQRSANLVDWEDWQTVSRDSGPSELVDSEAGTTPYRFYRGIGE